MKKMKLAFLGVGNMASAILTGLQNITDDRDIYLYDPLPAATARFADRAYNIAVSASAAVEAADCVIFAVKPQTVPALLEELQKSGVCTGKTVVSIAAGVPIAAFTRALGELPMVRTMPNTPMLISAGMTALCRNPLVDDETFAAIRRIFDATGDTIVLDESDMNKIISVTSSSPAYIFLMIDSIWKSGLAQGLPEEGLLEAVCSTVIGSARLVRETGKSPEELIAMVCSKKGTTEQAMLKLAEHNFPQTIHEAMVACTNRADELGRL